MGMRLRITGVALAASALLLQSAAAQAPQAANQVVLPTLDVCAPAKPVVHHHHHVMMKKKP